MKALFYTGPNELAIQETPIPEPKPGEVLIKVAYTGICGTDMLAYHGGMEKRVKPPVILGHEFSGTIHAIGGESAFQVGDKVTVEPLITCGECYGCKTGEYNLCTSLNLIGIDSDGGIAEYIKVPEAKVYRLGDDITMQEGALIEPLAVCVHMVEKGSISENQTVLIVGGGPIGIITGLVAQLKGAKVVISEVNPFRIEMASKFGFKTINPTQQDFAGALNKLTNNQGADVTIEATGTNGGLVACIEGARIKGTVILAGLPKKNADFDTYRIIAKELNITGTRVYKKEDYNRAIELLKNKKIDLTPLISNVIPLESAAEKGFVAIDNGDNVIKILIEIPGKDEKI
ncbi:zinc-dependent alcohol dehydrogenase [Cytobacillus oceanisediminis]|uniref:zinc-dependent alcohol dehydrogenase n=1 Tax=Cytobacillus oceanisediminis TaxID=665099 RepID=UPI0037364927